MRVVTCISHSFFFSLNFHLLAFLVYSMCTWVEPTFFFYIFFHSIFFFAYQEDKKEEEKSFCSYCACWFLLTPLVAKGQCSIFARVIFSFLMFLTYLFDNCICLLEQQLFYNGYNTFVVVAYMRQAPIGWSYPWVETMGGFKCRTGNGSNYIWGRVVPWTFWYVHDWSSVYRELE